MRRIPEFRRLWCEVAVASCLVSAVAVAQQPALPPGATPGGVLPRINQLPAQPDSTQELFTIPKVSERELGLEEGARVKVTAFQLQGVVDRPKHGISAAEIKALLAQVVQTQPENGLTVNQMAEAAKKVSNYYFQHGFVLAQAFIPAQKVIGGVVTVQVLEGKLAAVKFEGNKMYSSGTLLRPFNGLLGGPVDKSSLESALLTLTDYPGLSAYGVLKAGTDVGTTDLDVSVQREQRAELYTQFDNEGAQYAGEYRGQVALTLNDLIGDADRFRGYALYGFEPSESEANGLYGGIDYQAPIFGARDLLDLSAIKDTYKIAGTSLGSINSLEPKGDTYLASLGYRHVLVPTRLTSSSLGLTFGVADATFKEQGQDQFRDKLTTLAADYQLSNIDPRFRGVNELHVTYTHGFKNALGSLGDYDPTAPAPASRVGATGDFDKVVVDAERLQRITKNLSLLLRATGQYTNDPLVSLEQLAVTGPDAVRAYSVSQVLADRGVVVTGEFILAAPGFYDRAAFAGRTWGQVLQFSAFIDYADAKLIGQLAQGQQATTTLSGAGGSVQLNVPNHVFARVDVAKPLSNLRPTDHHDPEIYFRLGFNFF